MVETSPTVLQNQSFSNGSQVMNKNRHLIKMQRTSNPRLALEPRIVFDAAIAATGADVMDHNSDHSSYVSPATGEAARDAVVAATKQSATEQNKDTVPVSRARSETSPPAARVEIIFVDAAVQDIQTYLVGKNAEVITLRAGSDGVDQIAQALLGRTDVSAIHIVSHGKAGELQLGTGVLNTQNIGNRYAEDMAIIKNALTSTGDLLVYGCRVGEGVLGQRFITALSGATGADVAASSDDTGATKLGGNWVLETTTGGVETLSIGVADWDRLLNVAATNGSGALLGVSGHDIYSIDVATGKAVLLTTIPTTVGGITISATANSLAVDQANGLLYYTDSAAVNSNRALFAYDFLTPNLTDAQRHFVVDTDLGTKGLLIGARGVGSGSATFAKGTLYLGIENNGGSAGTGAADDDTIYRITFSANGRAVTSSAVFVATVAANDWGDMGYSPANNIIESVTPEGITRYDADTGAVLGTFLGLNSNVQAGETVDGKTYRLGTTLQEYSPTTGAPIGTAITLTTDGTTALARGLSDAAGSTSPTSTVGGMVFSDNNANGVFDAGDTGVAGVTIELVDDVNNNGVVDSGERVLATDTTSATGGYLFNNVLPGNYIVRVTDTGGVLGVNAIHTYTQTDSAVAGNSQTAVRSDIDVAAIGQNILTANFGVKNAAPVLGADTFNMKQGATIVGGLYDANGATADKDADADAFTISQINGSTFTVGTAIVLSNGTLTITNAATGAFKFVANDNATGPQSFTYTVNDAHGAIVTANVNIAITNLAPVINLNAASSLITNGSFEAPAVPDVDANNVQVGNTLGPWTSNRDGLINVIRVDGNSYFEGPQSAADGVQYVDFAGSGGEVSQKFTVANAGTLNFGAEFANRDATVDGYTNPNGKVEILNADGIVVATSDTSALTAANGKSSWYAVTGSAALAAGNYTLRISMGNFGHVDNAYANLTGNYSTAYLENAAPVSIADASCAVADVDDTNIESATITLTNRQAGDILSVIGTLPIGIVAAAYDSSTGVITLSGTGTRVDYATAIRQIGFSNTTDTPDPTNRIVNVVVNDGQIDSNIAVTTILVTPVNDAPAGTNATLTAVENSARTFMASDFGFTDPKDSPANTLQSVVIKTLPANGMILFNGVAINAGDEFTVAQLAQLTFTAAPNTSGTAYTTFTFQVRDDGGTANGGVDLDQSPNTITLNVTAVNHPPVANPDTAGVVESGVNPDGSAVAGTPTASGNVTANDTDPDSGDTKTVSAVNGQAGNVGTVIDGIYGSVKINADGSYTYTLDNTKAATQALAQGQAGTPEVFNYTVKDTAGATSTSTLTVNVSGTNDAPVANADTASTPLNVALDNINVKGNDTDVDSPAASLVVSAPVMSNPAQGSVTLNPDGTLKFTAASGVSGPVVITYTLTDDKGASSIGTLTVNVGANNPPVANPDTAGVVESGVNPDGSAVAGTPTASGNVTANDTDPDSGDTKTVSAVNGQAGNVGTVIDGIYGSVKINADGSYTYTLDNTKAATQALAQGQAGTPEVFNYTVKDTAGATSTSTLTVNVSGTNDAPVANADTASTPLNVALDNINVKGNDTDVDSPAASLVVSAPVMSNPAQGSVTLNPDGTLKFTAASGVSGPVVITYTLTDDKGASSIGTLTVNVGANNPPDSVDKTVLTTENKPVSFAAADFAFSDADPGQTLAAVRIDSLPANGSLLLNGVAVRAGQIVSAADIAAGKLSYAPGLNGNESNDVSFKFSVQDSGGAFDAAPNTMTVKGTTMTSDPLVLPSERFIDAPPPNLTGQVIVTDPSLHVLYSVNDVRVDTGLRSGLGLFQTDSATMAELKAENALALDNLTEFRPTHALFVQHAVRQQALVSETGIFVQNSVRASQLESLTRNTQIDSFNSAISGVNTLLDAFALGAPVASAVTPIADALRGERQNPSAPRADLNVRDSVAQKASVMGQNRTPATAADDLSVLQAKRRAADGFAAQLRRNTASFRTSALRPETPINDTARVMR